jgi:4-hydroxy-2-oxoheptanedioate aldolase
MQSLRQLWSAGHTTFGAWLTIPSSVSAELATRVGYDYVCLDNQHGALDYQTSVSMIQACELGGVRPICRVPWNEPGVIGKMLDAGAQGVIVPMVNSPEEAEAAVRACRYAPRGARSSGPMLASARVADYHDWAADHVACIVMIETADAVARVDDILAVPGIDAVYVGPADLSITLGLPPTNNDQSPAFTDALIKVVAACERAGVVPGMHTTAPLVATRVTQGFRMVTVTSDTLAMRAGLAADLATARGTTPATPQGTY